MTKVRVTCFLVLIVLFFFGSAVMAADKIYHGIWSQSWPSGEGQAVADYYDLLTNTLKFNLIVGSVPPARIPYLEQYHLKAVGGNLGAAFAPYPDMYAHMSTYVTFFAKGQPYSGEVCDTASCWNSTWSNPYFRKLSYNQGGVYTQPDSSRKFRAGVDAAGLVQEGPYIKKFVHYWNAPWDLAEPSYLSEWKYKVGPNPNPGPNDTIAAFMVLYGDSLSWDTLKIHYLLDSQFAAADTVYKTETLQYDFQSHVPLMLNLGDSLRQLASNRSGAGGNHYFSPAAPADAVTDSLVQFAIHWRGNRDFTIQSVTAHDEFGFELVTTPGVARDKISGYYDLFSGVGLNSILKWHLAEENTVVNPAGFLPIRVVDSLCKTFTPVIKAYALILDTLIADYRC